MNVHLSLTIPATLKGIAKNIELHRGHNAAGVAS
jgi:hypothetical protein